jgi:phosphoserine phosphatase
MTDASAHATHVATLICDPAVPALDTAVLDRVRAALSGARTPRWLEPGVAADLSFAPAEDDAEPRSVAEALRTALAGRPIDVVVQQTAHRRKMLLVADMDSTMIGQECIDELADWVGLRSQVAAITERAMKGEITFEPALRERLALLEGLPIEVIGDIFTQRIRATPGAATLVRTMRAHGAHTCLVSGGFTLFSARVAALIGFDEHRANRLLVADGRLTGRVDPPVIGPEAKLAALLELRTQLGLEPSETLAVGDGANDVPMLAEAGLGVAYHAKPKVIAAVEARIDHGDLTALLYLQGYSRPEFATD